MKENVVSAVNSEISEYPDPPFNPDKSFPELQNKVFLSNELSYNNKVYALVRKSFYFLGLDENNFGKKEWNPLKNIAKSGDNIVIKPNLVMDKHPLGKEGVMGMITHASVIRPIIDYVLLATDGDCKITICDVPLQSADWKKIIAANGLLELQEFYKKMGITINIIDLRYEVAIQNKEGVIYKTIKKVRDPLGYARVNLGKRSYIQDIIKDYKRLEITDYGLGTVSKHHNPKKNEYLIPRTILNSDVFINVPKLKTHKKAGVTLSLKNLIGINGDKSWIAHHRRGIDEYPKMEIGSYIKWKFAYYLKAFAPKFIVTIVYKIHRIIFLRGQERRRYNMNHRSPVMEGDWFGNDTIWRTILDLNNILFFSDKKGVLKQNIQRKYLTVIDGIIGMEKNGPMTGEPKKSGVIICGFHPVYADYAACHLMGFDYNKIHQIREGFNEKFFGLTKFPSELLIINGNIDFQKLNMKFIPAEGWKGHIER